MLAPGQGNMRMPSSSLARASSKAWLIFCCKAFLVGLNDLHLFVQPSTGSFTTSMSRRSRRVRHLNCYIQRQVLACRFCSADSSSRRERDRAGGHPTGSSLITTLAEGTGVTQMDKPPNTQDQKREGGRSSWSTGSPGTLSWLLPVPGPLISASKSVRHLSSISFHRLTAVSILSASRVLLSCSSQMVCKTQIKRLSSWSYPSTNPASDPNLVVGLVGGGPGLLADLV